MYVKNKEYEIQRLNFQNSHTKKKYMSDFPYITSKLF